MKTHLFFLSCFLFSCLLHAVEIPTSQRAEHAVASIEPILKKQLSEKKLKYGAPIFIRVFKKSAKLEVWVES